MRQGNWLTIVSNCINYVPRDWSEVQIYTCSCITMVLLSLDVSSPLYRDLSGLYSHPGCILAFHLEG